MSLGKRVAHPSSLNLSKSNLLPSVAYGLTLRLDILNSRSELMTRGASRGLIDRANKRASEVRKFFLTVAMKLSRV